MTNITHSEGRVSEDYPAVSFRMRSYSYWRCLRSWRAIFVFSLGIFFDRIPLVSS